MHEYIDAALLRNMFLSGTKYLENKKEFVNELNVFPVPDGDTGTNMSLTLLSAARELAAPGDSLSIRDFCSKVTTGTLKGARGNSGVIMSQLCRGFAQSIENLETVGRNDLADACENAVKTAYKAVLKPVEGTMLTVARKAGEKARELSASDMNMEQMLSQILNCASEVLARTPDMLPVLKEANVVDSGGQGLVEFLKGAYDAYTGKVNFPLDSDPVSEVKASGGAGASDISTCDIKYTYCTEFIIELSGHDAQQEEAGLKDFLGSIGDSVVCVGMDNLIKVHVHTNHPGQAIEKALLLGELSSLKIDNMRIEHNERLMLNTQKSLKKYGIISVCSGDGLREIFRNLGVDEIIDGGQTMNPSTQDFLGAIAKTDAENIFIMPNNSNIILAAGQAAELTSDKKVFVIPSTNVCEGINAVLGFDEQTEPDENESLMKEAMEQVKCAEVTYSVRNSRVDGKDIAKGDYMGISGGTCLFVCQNPEEAACRSAIELSGDSTQLITVYYGKSVNENRAETVRNMIEKEIDADVETVYGGQKIYDYIISVE